MKLGGENFWSLGLTLSKLGKPIGCHGVFMNPKDPDCLLIADFDNNGTASKSFIMMTSRSFTFDDGIHMCEGCDNNCTHDS